MRSHFAFNRKVAAACAVAGVTTLLNGGASAQTFIAADYATNSIYASGWTTNQNGGYGFTAWSFDGTFDGTGTNAPVEEEMTFDHSSPSDALGTAWTLFNPPGPGYGWIAVAGRGFAPLQPYQTFEVVIDNPTNVNYDGGYEVQLDSGTDNIYSNSPTSYSTTVPQVAAYTYGYFGQLGEWLVGDYYGNSYSSLYVSNTAPAGVKMDFTILPAGRQLSTHHDAAEQPGKCLHAGWNVGEPRPADRLDGVRVFQRPHQHHWRGVLYQQHDDRGPHVEYPARGHKHGFDVAERI